MNKFSSLMALALVVGAFVSCSDVPEPYGINLDTAISDLSDGQVINETFSSSLGTFQSKAVSGDYMWANQGHNCAQITSYVDGANNEADAYLVSPKVTLENEAYHLTFQYILRYGQAATLKQNHTVVVSRDYNGNPAEASWEVLDFTPVEGSDWNTWQSVDIAIPESYQGQEIVVAFRYIGTTTKAATWEVKNVILAKGSVNGGEEEKPDTGEAKTLPYEESFATSMGGFISQTTSGSGAWVIDYSTAKATGYDNSTKVTTAGTYFLVSPAINLDGIKSAHVAYEYILRYNKGDENQQILISSDYAGDAGKASWITLKKKHTEGSDWSTFTKADVTLPESFMGKTVRVAFVYNTNASSGSTWEVKNFSISEGTGSETADGSAYSSGEVTPTPTPSEAKGTGTLEDPYNVAAAIALASSLDDNAQSDVVYIKGKVVSIKENYGTQYGNATFYISDDGTTNGQFYVYRALYLNNEKYTSGDLLGIGDEVVICGKVTKYVSKTGTTLETAQNAAYLYSRNGSGGEDTPTPTPSEGTGKGTLESPFNAAAAISVATALGSGNTSSESYYIKGKISSIKYSFDESYGTATFFISDDGKTDGQFQVYSTYYLGNRSWKSGDTQIALGDDVIIYGQLTNYNGTPETAAKKSYIYSLNGTTDGGTPTPTPTPSEGLTLEDFTNGGFETWADGVPTGWKTTSSAGNATLTQSTDAHSGSFSVCVGGTTAANKRLGSTEMTLQPGTYNCSFWAKAATDKEASLCPGYAVIGSSITYMYDKGDDGKNKYVNNIVGTWQEVKYTFELTSASSVSLIIMNSKTTGSDLLIDDFTITKSK